jgi:hypothetical protein
MPLRPLCLFSKSKNHFGYHFLVVAIFFFTLCDFSFSAVSSAVAIPVPFPVALTPFSAAKIVSLPSAMQGYSERTF